MTNPRPVRVVHTSGALSAAQLDALLAAHARALATRRGLLKDGSRSAVSRASLGGQWFCVKEYRASRLRDRVRRWAGGSRARRAWRGALHLARLGIATPEPVAVVERGGTAYLVTRFIEGATPLNLLMARRFAGAVAAGELSAKRALLAQLAAWARSIHDLGVYHDDWSAKNILAAERGGCWAFWLLDTESLSPRKRLTYRRRVKNLAQLSDVAAGATRADKLRFLLAYARGDGSLTSGRFARDILAAAARRAEARERLLAAARREKSPPP